MTIYAWQSSQAKPNPQSMLAFIAVNKVGSIIGNDKIAVKVELLLVLEAMAELRLKTVEIPKLPKKRTRMKRLLFSTGLPSSKLNNKKVSAVITNCKTALNNILERIIAFGFAKV